MFRRSSNCNEKCKIKISRHLATEGVVRGFRVEGGAVATQVSMWTSYTGNSRSRCDCSATPLVNPPPPSTALIIHLQDF